MKHVLKKSLASALIISVIVNVALAYRQIDIAKITDGVEVQSNYQKRALVFSLAVMQKRFEGKQRQEVIEFLDAIGVEYFSKQESIETDGFLIVLIGEKVASVGPLGW